MDLLSINDTPGQHAPSWYAATANTARQYAALNGNIECDVCVIGAGFTGLSTALHLAQAGIDTVLIDANCIGWGASGRNGGQVGSGQRVDQWTLEKQHGLKTATDLWQLAVDSCDLVRQLITEHEIKCDYKAGVLDASVSHAEHIQAEQYVEHLRKNYQHEHLEVFDQEGLAQVLASDAYAGGVLDHSSGHCHPLNFALGLAEAAEKACVRVFEHTRVSKLKVAKAGGKHTVVTHQGSISASRIVLACNGYLGNLEPQIAKRVMPINNYIVATEPLGEQTAKQLIANDMAIADSRFIVNYFRMSADHRLLFGGGESWNYQFPGDIRKLVRPRMLSVFPQLEDIQLDFAWGGTLAITRSRMPCFREVQTGVFSASGYSGHGVAMATLAGQTMAQALSGDRRRFDLMSGLPSPGFPGGRSLRQPLLVAAMAWYALHDRLA